MNEAFSELMQDHREVERLFEEFKRTNDHAVALKVCSELTVHAVVEEELVYPLYHTKVDWAEAQEARREHDEAKTLISVIEGLEPDSSELAPTMEKLEAAVSHHVEEEEHELFPKMESTIGGIVSQMGNDVRARKAELTAQMAVDRSLGMSPSTTGEKPVAGG